MTGNLKPDDNFPELPFTEAYWRRKEGGLNSRELNKRAHSLACVVASLEAVDHKILVQIPAGIKHYPFSKAFRPNLGPT